MRKFNFQTLMISLQNLVQLINGETCTSMETLADISEPQVPLNEQNYR